MLDFKGIMNRFRVLPSAPHPPVGNTDAVVGRFGSAVVAIMTVTDAETDSVTQSFSLLENMLGTPYRCIEGENKSAKRMVHRRMLNQTNIVSAMDCQELIEDFRPELIFLIGTAGGHSDRDGLALGDVVVANYLEYSGYWKYTDGDVVERKIAHDHPSCHLLQNFVEPLRNDTSWAKRISHPRPSSGSPKVLVGGIVSGNTLMGDSRNLDQQRIMDHFDKAYAFEMEAIGVSQAVYRARRNVHYNPQFLVVRGISDLVDKSPEENQVTRVLWTPYAVAAACAFVQELLSRIFASRDLEALPFSSGTASS